MEEKARVSYSPSNKNLIQLPYHFLKIDLLSSLDELNKSIRNDLNLLILEEGNIKYSDIESIKKYLTLSDINLEGAIVITL